MTKIYNSPMLQVVSIKKNDIIVTSDPNALNLNLSAEPSTNSGIVGAPGLRDVWDEVY